MTTSAVITCADLASNPSAVASTPCLSGQGLLVVQAYLPDPSSAYDSVQASGFFLFGFGVVIFGFLLGFVVQQIRKPILRGSS